MEVAAVEANGKLRQRIRRPTQAERGPAAVKANLVAAPGAQPPGKSVFIPTSFLNMQI